MSSTAMTVLDEGGGPVVAQSGGVDLGGAVVSLDQAIGVAQRLEGAITLPKHFRTAADLTAAVLMAMQWRVPLMAVIRGCHMIEGKISPSADLMVGIAMGSGLVVDWREEDLTDPVGCRVTVVTRDGRTTVSIFTMADAHAAGLDGRDTWKRYGRDMCRARAVSRAAGRSCPQVFAGIYSQEELAPAPLPAEAAPVPEPQDELLDEWLDQLADATTYDEVWGVVDARQACIEAGAWQERGVDDRRLADALRETWPRVAAAEGRSDHRMVAGLIKGYEGVEELYRAGRSDAAIDELMRVDGRLERALRVGRVRDADDSTGRAAVQAARAQAVQADADDLDASPSDLEG